MGVKTCPNCNDGKVKIIDTRPNLLSNTCLRRYECSCGHRFSTRETVEAKLPRTASPKKAHNIITLPVITRLQLDADITLESLKGLLDGFVLAGYDKDGGEFFSSTYPDGDTGLWLLEKLKIALLKTGE